MKMFDRIGFGSAAAVWTLAVGAVLAWASPAAARQAEEERPMQVMLLLERAALKDALPSEKDAALAGALGMIPAAIEGFIARADEQGMVPDDVVGMIRPLMTGSFRLAVVNRGFDPQTGMPGIGAVISIRPEAGDEATARDMHRRVEAVRGMSPMPFRPSPSRRFDGMTDLPLPVGVLSYGPRRAADGWRYEFIFAAIDDPDAPFALLPAVADGVRPALRAKVDMAAWSPLIQMFAGFAAMASPQGKMMLDQMRESGMIGPDAVFVELTHGFSADASVGTWTVGRAARSMQGRMFSRSPVTPEDLAVIPEDASYAQIQKMNTAAYWDMAMTNLQQAHRYSGQPVPDGADTEEVFEQYLGFNPRTELIDALGETMIMYLSDSTGGGALMSGVLMMELKDSAKMQRTLGTIASRLGGLIAEAADGPFTPEITRMSRGGVELMQLRFPGLPVPLEPTIGVAGKWLVAGMTPQAAFAAAKRAADPVGAGLAANRSFASSRWSLPEGHAPTGVVFVDTSRTLRDGFTTVAMAGSALANFVRSRAGETPVRDPGLVMPPYSELIEGARPLLVMSYWRGEDFVSEWRGDRSLLVAAAGLLGVGDMAPFVAGAIAGAGAGGAIAEQMRGGDGPFPSRPRAPGADEPWRDEQDDPAERRQPAPY